MLNPRYSTFGMEIYMMGGDATDECEVVEVLPPMKTSSQEIIDLTLDDNDNNILSSVPTPTQLSYNFNTDSQDD
jgi:hypothetical protein